MRPLLAVLGVAAAIILAGPAHGDPVVDSADVDRDFLDTLRAAGITYTRADQAVMSGRTVCKLVASGTPAPGVLHMLQGRNPELTVEHASQFIGIAMRSYCPGELTPAEGG